MSGKRETLDGGHLLFPVRQPALILVLRGSRPEVTDRNDSLLLQCIPFFIRFCTVCSQNSDMTAYVEKMFHLADTRQRNLARVGSA
jgi:hypothetical protein